MNKQTNAIASTLVLLLTVICLNLSQDSTARLKRIFSSFFIPLFSLQKGTEQIGDFITDNSTPRKILLQELQDLKQTNQVLHLRLAQNQNLILENENLRKQLKLVPKREWNPRLTRVVGRDPANWWHSALIDLGSTDGIKIDMPVLATEGLVGRVQEVHPHRSRVALLGDPACRISVTVKATGESGVLNAGGGTVFDPAMVDLLFLPASTEARPGDTLFTSGLGEIFPRGILVGKLLAVEPAIGALTTTAQVKLSVNPSKLNEVWVLMQ
jgi:rod shape-determining protein MreC